ncbi:hypothetical protein PISMIDRAFT_684145 [Pisolithus microcarpus 441]|uniref:Uncharacterized protein n=1 Tax=Pisolithus microcarpus 441 TaxID=765257 RepID=A0A0C9ZEV1_9AGAM|nr:hypothetical protein BKA83DRAFT_684145 [Pisolithus microcarpus]KIK18478.1 hypothetical protein PISMIDRAFT_684145 [Pisolithus microcarpus 441]
MASLSFRYEYESSCLLLIVANKRARVLVRGVVIYPDRVGVGEVITLDCHGDCDRAAHLP